MLTITKVILVVCSVLILGLLLGLSGKFNLALLVLLSLITNCKNIPLVKGIISRLIDLYNGHTHFDLRLITHDLFTQKCLFTDVLIPQHSIVIKQMIFYVK